MKIKPVVRTAKEIDQIVAGIGGTWVKRRNARAKLVDWSNKLVDEDINIQRTQIRKLKASGAKQSDLRCHYSEITKLEMMKHE